MTTTSYLAKFGINGSHVGYFSRPAKPVEPVRPVVGCQTCHLGCDCEGGIEGVGCEHWGCWGRAATDDCAIGADALRVHMNAYREYSRALLAYQQTSHLR